MYLEDQKQDLNDEQLAAEWEEMTHGSKKSDKKANKDNSNAKKEDTADKNSGVEAIINSTSVAYERLPMLEVIFDRLVRMMTTSLRNFTSENIDVTLEQNKSVRFGDYLDKLEVPSMIIVVKANEWDNYALLTIDRDLIYSIVDVLLGGKKGKAHMPIEGRSYTTIERVLMERMARVILNDLSAAFDPISPVKFRFERLETNPRFASIARSANAAILSRFHIEMDERGGNIDLIIPNATLEPVRDLLLQMFLGEKFGRDSIWETHLAREIWQTDIHIEAILDTIKSPLTEVLKWQVGSKIDLKATTNSRVTVRCDKIPVFIGRMGQKNGNISIKVEDLQTLKEKEDLE